MPALLIVAALASPVFAQGGTALAPTTSLDQNGGLSPLAPQTIISDPSIASAYVLGPGDVVTITVEPQTKYGLSQAPIEQDGSLEYPRLGTLNASGKTVTQFRDEITTDLAKYCVSPSVTVQVIALRPQVVYVTGGVKTPKILDVRSAPNVAKAITLADGALDANELSHVSVFRDGKIIQSNVYGVLVNGVDTGDNVVLQPGDLVVVPINTAKYAVVGAVNSPGLYSLTLPGGNEGPTHLAEALAAAGGAQRSGARIHAVQIVHIMPNGTTKTLSYDYGGYVKNADSTQNPVISDRDLIFVPDSKHAANAGDALGYLSYFAILKGL
jgi:polysaccharide export outer membrane protein